MSLADAVDLVAGRQPRRVAIQEGVRALTFDELFSLSRAISQLIEPVLPEPGQRGVLLLPNSAAFVAGFFAIARVGGVVAPLNPQYRSQELAYYLRDLDPAVIVTDARFVDGLRAVFPRLERRPAIITCMPGGPPARIDAGEGQASVIEGGEDRPLLQQYTSGSTGAPKRVVRSHERLITELEALRRTFGVSERDRFLGVTPFFHVNGLVRTMLTSMSAGASLYPLPEFRRREVLDLLTRERLTYFGGVAQMFAVLGQTPRRGAVDLSALRVVFSSSAPLLPIDARAIEAQYGLAVRQLYGSTETGTISVNVDDDPSVRRASVGHPLPGVRVDVMDETGRVLPAGEEGEIVITSPYAAREYVGNATATAEAFRGARYFSGDLGTKDADGAIRLTGRKKFLINRGGFKVNPFEVEDAVRDHPKVRDVAVTGAPGPHGDEIVCAHIVLKAPCTEEDIVAHCRERIADFKVPSRVEFRDTLPVGPTGKVLRAQLQA
jgi:long-chain acyl-CoA synthetase